jgi:hypothetical protein
MAGVEEERMSTNWPTFRSISARLAFSTRSVLKPAACSAFSIARASFTAFFN